MSENQIKLPNYDLSEIQHLIYSKNIKPLNTVMIDTLKKLGLYDNILKTKIKKIWHYIVGPQATKYTAEILVKQNRLYVKITAPALRYELNLQRKNILQKINTILNSKLTDIVIY